MGKKPGWAAASNGIVTKYGKCRLQLQVVEREYVQSCSKDL
jgi:hypothetical protein